MVVLQGILICVLLYSVSILLFGVSTTAVLFVVHVAVVPLIFKYSKTFRRNLIFANFVQWPLNVDYENPSASGIVGGRNLMIDYQSKVDKCNVQIGLWHILPKDAYERLKGSFQVDMDKERLNKLLEQELASTTSPIVIYCHGNSNSRVASHRVLLYKFFQKMNYHTIAFDYRGYGDSTNLSPSEAGVVEDSLVVYEWLYNTCGGVNEKRVFVWGHSLGTAIASHLLGNLPTLCRELLGRESLPMPRGLILEAPFKNMADEVADHPLSKLVAWLPYYDSAFLAPMRDSPTYSFRSDRHLARAPHLPILVLHADDDGIVPVAQGLKLYNAVLASRSPGDARVQLHRYDKSQRLGHKLICTANDLSLVIGKFVASPTIHK